MTMTGLRAALLTGLIALACSSARADGDKPAPAPQKPKDCVDVRGQASWASVGYDHVVTVTNSCKQAMRCSVKTNVNPDATTLDLEPGESKSVVTWRGSPAREFTPDVSCSERKGSSGG